MILILIFIFGLVLGSFVNASVWRIHKQSQSKANRTKKYSIIEGRSMCPNCKHTLAPLDLIPLVSWIVLGGKCRYCKEPISIQYPLAELLTAVLFIFSYIYWPYSFSGAGLVYFVFWLLFVTGFVGLIIYDFKWQRLPNRITYLLIGLALVQLAVSLIAYKGGLTSVIDAFWGVLISAGIFYALLIVSNGAWIGGGDVKLGVVIGLIIGGPINSVLMLLFSSLIGTIYSIPLLLTGRAKKDSKVPFGPFLILAAIIVELFGTSLINYYQKLFI
jgi:leader peptidase (prepilin peptidase)/N-methyltransferase